MTTTADFWTARKARVKAEAEADLAARASGEEKAELAALDERTDEEILSELDLPDPDEMKTGDDFSRFMSKAVPERLRRRALRKLWLSNPVLANLDGLVDYADDYSDAAAVAGNLQTGYLVGKGMLAHVLEMEKEQAQAESTVEATAIETEGEPVTEVSRAADDSAADETAGREFVGGEPEVDDKPSRRSRMRFSFDPEPAGEAAERGRG